MAQYTDITLGNPLTISRSTLSFRYDVRGGLLYLDQTRTITGFSGVENRDWSAIEIFTASGTGVFRIGARNLFFCIDEELDVTGFTGAENVNWATIDKYKLP